MKKTLTSLVIITFFLTCLQIPCFATDAVNYKTGLLVDSYTDISEHFETTSTILTLPDSVDNTSFFPSPGDQGQQNSCVGWAVGYALKSGIEYRKREWTISNYNHQFSPSYLYNQINNGTDGGASILDALDLLETQGCCTLPYFPYNQNNYTKQPTTRQMANANLYKISEYHTLLGINQIKEKISQHYGVVIGIKIYSDFTNLSQTDSIFDDTSGNSQGQHAICLIGYDDAKSAFKFINSWGTDWGVNGYGWISYDAVVDASPIFNFAIGYYIKTGADMYTMGDIDGNGVISVMDSRLALIGANNPNDLTAEQFVLADVNGDAALNNSDAQEILSAAAGHITKFSIYQ